MLEKHQALHSSSQETPASWPQLRALAAKYVWWKSPDEAMRWPERIVLQVMNIGDYDDVCAMVAALGDNKLQTALAHAEAGQLSARSWHYWHYRLGLCSVGKVPPQPVRSFGEAQA